MYKSQKASLVTTTILFGSEWTWIAAPVIAWANFSTLTLTFFQSFKAINNIRIVTKQFVSDSDLANLDVSRFDPCSKRIT